MHTTEAVTEKACTRCGETKPLENFYSDRRSSDGKQGRCKPCHNDRGHHNNYSENRRKWNLFTKYGISVEQYEELLLRQGGVCKICGNECSSGRRLSVDHCHETGRVRGLLCVNCNHGVGKFNDDPERLEAAARYLRGE